MGSDNFTEHCIIRLLSAFELVLLPLKVNIHQLSYGYVAWRVTVICFIVFNLMQILYLVGVGLFLIIDLLTFTYSQGMFYHNSSLILIKV